MTDETIWDSWEDFADSGDIDKHVEQGLNISGKSKKHKEKSKVSKQADQASPGPQRTIRILQRPAVIHEEDQNSIWLGQHFGQYFGGQKSVNHSEQEFVALRSIYRILRKNTLYRTAYKPQLKILKRPEKSPSEMRSEEEERRRLMAQNPVRTLAQREAAYAEARQRIMGDDATLKANDSAKHNDSRNDARPENLRRYSKQSKSGQQNGYAVDVKRQPKGPGNNGKGFKTNR